jgi:hypothetical protein
MAQSAGPARPGLVGQPLETRREEPSPPLADLMLVHAHRGGDAPQRHPIGAQQDDFRPPCRPHRRSMGTGPALQLGSFVLGQLDRLDGEHATSRVGSPQQITRE